jgi:diguanylate cyclase (GGDEF)-like protein
MWDPSTLRLTQDAVTLFQALGEPAGGSACLILYSGDDQGRRLALDRASMALGRAPDCELPIDNPAISRRHAELLVDGDRVTLRDLGSVNGSFVNDQRLRAPTVLKDGDLVRLGNVLLKFYERQSLDALLHDRIYRLATIDAGTDVFSKRFVLDALEREIRQARRSARPLALICIDLDHFKQVNDRHGHNIGDLVLLETAQVLKSGLRSGDILGRIGGEEFAAVLPDTDLAAATALAERLCEAVAARPIVLPASAGAAGAEHRQTVSIGVAAWSATLPGGRDLLGAADTMLYAAKHAGRNRVSA